MNQDRNPNPQPPSALTTDQPASGEPTTERPLQTPLGTVPQPRTADLGVGPILLGCLVWVVVILSAISILSITARQFLFHWWWGVGGGIIALALLGWLIGPVRKWFTKAAEEKRTAVVVFVFLPLLLVVFGTIFLIPLPEYRITVVRSIFLVAVCLFPALLYYLFILARRISLLNDYFLNLEKLGLLKEYPESGTDAMIERPVRVNTYLQKFEALYGPLDSYLRSGIMAMNNPLFGLSQAALGLVSPPAPGSVSPPAPGSVWPPAQDSGSSRGIPIFSAETAIPVVLATILIAVGWLMALPPTGFEKVQQATTASQSSTQKAEESSPTPGPGSPPPASTPAQSHNEQSSLAQGKREDVTAPAALTASTQLTSAAHDAPTAAPGSPSQAPTANQSDEKQASPTAGKGEGVTPSATRVKPSAQKFASEEKEGNSSAFWSAAFRVTRDPIIYAFLGAYFFSLQMLFRRYVSEDLRKSAYLAVSLRIVLAVIGTWAAITAIKAMWEGVNAEWLLVVGFVIGVFPRIAWQFIQGAWKALMQKSGLSAALPSMESRLRLSDLDGLTVWHEARLEEEDIENIPNMATAEIVDLMLSTRFPPDRIIDWVDQAILFTHLGPDPEGVKEGEKPKNLLRVQGIRTATSLIEAFEAAQIKGRDDSQEVKEILSKALGTQGHIRSFLDAIKTEPNLALVGAWRRMPVEWTSGVSPLRTPL